MKVEPVYAPDFDAIAAFRLVPIRFTQRTAAERNFEVPSWNQRPVEGIVSSRESLMSRIQPKYWFIVIGCCISVTAVAEVTVTTVALPGGSSAVGAFTMASCYGQPTMLAQATAGSMIESPGYLCVESSDLGILGDLNDDGHVNGIDLAIVLGNWGACGAGACVADIDRDGWVNGVDLAIVLGSWG